MLGHFYALTLHTGVCHCGRSVKLPSEVSVPFCKHRNRHTLFASNQHFNNILNAYRMKQKRKPRVILATALIAVSAALLMSCGKIPSREEALAQRKQERETQMEKDRAGRFFKSQFQGHSYVLYETPNTWDGCVRTSILHDPDCPCQKGGAL